MTIEKMIKHPYNGVVNHPHMSSEDRAAQFAPYAALSGYEYKKKKDGTRKEKFTK